MSWKGEFATRLILATVIGANSFSPVRASEEPRRMYLPIVLNSAGGEPFISLEEFARSVIDGEEEMARGVYVSGDFALKIEQQPTNDYGYITTNPRAVSQFSLAQLFEVTGLLAHNGLAGSEFFELAYGEEVNIILGNGGVENYQVSLIYIFQALEPRSDVSPMMDLSTGETLTASEVFDLVYTGDDHVTFQTCISRDGIPTWGRLFVVATPK